MTHAARTLALAEPPDAFEPAAAPGDPIALIVGDLKDILAQVFKRDVTGWDPETRLFNGGAALNSTQMIELTLAFERLYDIELEPALLTAETFSDLGTLARAIHACRAAGPQP